MKTAISIPDEIFNAAEIKANELGMARSQFFTIAVKELLERMNSGKITDLLNKVYSEDPNSSELSNISIARLREAVKNDTW